MDDYTIFNAFLESDYFDSIFDYESYIFYISIDDFNVFDGDNFNENEKGG